MTSVDVFMIFVYAAGYLMTQTVLDRTAIRSPVLKTLLSLAWPLLYWTALVVGLFVKKKDTKA